MTPFPFVAHAAAAAFVSAMLLSTAYAQSSMQFIEFRSRGEVLISVDGKPVHLTPGGRYDKTMFLGVRDGAALFSVNAQNYLLKPGQMIGKETLYPPQGGNAAPQAAKSPVALQGLAPNQPEGYFCPAGWQPNPVGAVRIGATFKCFAGESSTIPSGWSCPTGMELQDHSKTGMLICKGR